jgi:NarL family two-component system response regulator LiaR
MDGPTATAQILARCPNVKIIALTSFVEEALVQNMVQAGAIGYLLKDVHSDQLAEAIRAVYHGRSMIDATAAQVLIQASTRPSPPGDDLTHREREVLALLVDGKTNIEIAERLSISTGTARLHVSNILAKLGASNRTEATRLALLHKLVT